MKPVHRQHFGARIVPCLLLLAVCSLSAADVTGLIEELGSSDAQKRRNAAFELHQLGPEAVDALPALIQALDDDQDQVFFHAVSAIAKIGPAAEPAIPALMSRLGPVRSRYGEQVNLRAAFALSRIGEAAVAPLLSAVRDSDETLCSNAIEALASMPPAVSAPAIDELVKLLGDDRERVAASVVRALSTYGKSIVPHIVEVLQNGSVAQKRDSIRALGLLGKDAESSAAGILGAVQEGDPQVLIAALDSLVRIRYSPAETTQLIVRGLQSKDETVFNAAADSALLLYQVYPALDTTPFAEAIPSADEATRLRFASVLGRMDAAAAPAAPALIAAAEQASSQKAALSFADSLGGIGESAVPLLIEAAGKIPSAELTEESWPVAALASIGQPAVGPLRHGLKSPNNSSRKAAVATLGLLGTKALPAIEELFATLNDPDSDVRGFALIALPRAGVPSERLLPVLEPLASDASSAVRAQAFRAMGNIKDADGKTLPLLRKGMQDSEMLVQISAIEAAGNLGENGVAAVPFLKELLEAAPLDMTTDRERAAIVALGKIGPGAEPAVSVVIPRLASSDADVRVVSLASLGAMGSGASSALSDVRTTLTDIMPEVRAQAVEAVADIEGDADQLTKTLVEALNDPSESVRDIAIKELTEVGEKARPAAPRLFEMLEGAAEPQPIIEALRNIRTTDHELYVSVLENGSPSVRLFACESLGRFGGRALSALPKLEKLQQDDQYDFVRRRAAQAIERINRRRR
ncbi:MAG: HEAT repeat domain-containing protein [Verrucomicrobiales bacterium]